MNIVVGCDEAAFELKEAVKDHLVTRGIDVIDIGVFDKGPVLYPDIAERVCSEIIQGKAKRGVLMCGTGIGMAISANKMPGISAAVGHDLFSVERSRKSNDCQILCFGARVIASQYALMLLDAWLANEFAGGASAKKVAAISAIEDRYRLFENSKSNELRW